MGYSKTGVISYKKKPEKGEPGPKGPFVYPAGIYVQGSDTQYTATALTAPMVVFENQMYILNVVGTVGSDLNPKDDYAANGSKATWVLMPQYKAAYYEIFFAEFAKLGSAIFSGDYMLSQHGVDENGQPSTRYDLFGEQTAYGENKFTPNVMIDWLTGKFRGKDVEIEGKVDADRGKIGTWHIVDGGIVSEDFKYPDLSENNVTGGRGNMFKSGGGLLMCPTMGGALNSSTGKLIAGIIKAESESKTVHGLHLLAHAIGNQEHDRNKSVRALVLKAENDSTNPDEVPLAIDVLQGHCAFTGTSNYVYWAEGSITVTGEITAVATNKDIYISGRNLKNGHNLRIINVTDTHDITITGAVSGNEYARRVKQGCSRSLILVDGQFRPESDSK